MMLKRRGVLQSAGARKINNILIHLISYPITGEDIKNWGHSNDFTHVLASCELKNISVKNSEIVADTTCFENLDKRLISVIAMTEANGQVIQYQTPAMGLEQEGPDTCVTLCGFSLYVTDLPDYDSFQDQCDASDPCAIVERLECCLLELSLDKESKASFNYRDTSMSFRKPDVVFIDKMLERYKMKCADKCRGKGRKHNNRRFRIPC